MLKTNLVEAFYRTQSFRCDTDKGFRLASGLFSPYYVDCRSLMAQPSARALVAELAWQRLNQLPIDCIGGLEIGAPRDEVFVGPLPGGWKAPAAVSERFRRRGPVHRAMHVVVAHLSVRRDMRYP